MKVMIVTPYFYPKVGGLENYALHIAKGLEKQGHDILIVTSNHKEKRQIEETVQGLRVIRLPIQFKFSNTPVSLTWHSQLKKIIRDESPDVINAHSPVPFMADMAIRAAGKRRTVLTYHAATLQKSGSFLFNVVAKLYTFMQRPTFRKATAIIAVSDYVKSCLPSKYQQKTTVVGNAVDLTEIPQTNVPRIPKRLIFIGSLDKTHAWKGLHEILEAVKILAKSIPHVELLILGDGNMRHEYEALTHQLGLDRLVTFKGTVQGAAKYKLIKSATVLIAYPTTENDAFPTVFPEAWACHTPIVAANIGALQTLITDGINGLLAPPRSPKKLSLRLEKLLKDTHLQQKLAENGYKDVVNQYNWTEQTLATTRILERATRLRVCFINNIIPPYRLPFLEEINKKYDLTVLFCKPITKDRAWKYDLSKYTFTYYILKGFSIGPIIFNSNALSKLLQIKFDMIMTNSDPDIAPTVQLAFLLAKLKRKRILIWSVVTDEKVHYFPSVAYSPSPPQRIAQVVFKNIVLLYRRLCFYLSNGFLVLSQQARTFLEEHGVSNNLITFTPQIMPMSLLPDPDVHTPRDGKTFLYIGYLTERKGVNYLIEAFKEIQDDSLRLIIAGSGTAETGLKKLASGDKRITFPGYMEGVAKANLYSQADIFVLPTLQDVWALVINEAIHYGLAVLCSDAATAKEIVDDRTGKIFRAADVLDLRRAMTSLITDQKKLKEIQAHNFHKKSVSNLAYSSKGFNLAIERAFE